MANAWAFSALRAASASIATLLATGFSAATAIPAIAAGMPVGVHRIGPSGMAGPGE